MAFLLILLLLCALLRRRGAWCLIPLVLCGCMQQPVPGTSAENSGAQLQSTEPADSHTSSHTTVVKPRDLTEPGAFSGIWTDEDAQNWLQIRDNMTCVRWGADGEPLQELILCERPREDEMILRDAQGGELNRLKLLERNGELQLADSEGTRFYKGMTAPNGRYICYMGTWSLEGTSCLWLTIIQNPWITDAQMTTLGVGDTLHFGGLMMPDFPITAMRKKSDTQFLINGSLLLTRNEQLGAWELTGWETPWHGWIGNCELNLDTEFSDAIHDPEHDKIEDCLEEEEPVYGVVTVKNGVAVSVEITTHFEELKSE